MGSLAVDGFPAWLVVATHKIRRIAYPADWMLLITSPRYAAVVIWMTIKNCAQVVCTPVHLKRTAWIAFAVGSWLNLFNHGDELMRGAISAHLAIKLALNYLTPFIVSNIGLLARQRH